MQMKAAVMRVRGKPRPYADSHPMTIETVDFDPPGHEAAMYQRGKLPVQKLRSGFVTFDQINEGFDRLADGAVLRQVPRPHA
jgi:hypothetical protein